jgi:hypothetical protein
VIAKFLQVSIAVWRGLGNLGEWYDADCRLEIHRALEFEQSQWPSAGGQALLRKKLLVVLGLPFRACGLLRMNSHWKRSSKLPLVFL